MNNFLFHNHLLIPHFWIMFGFMAAITLGVYLISVLGFKIDGKNQAFVVLSAIVFRFLGSMIFVLIYLQKNSVDGVLFIANFFSIYLLLTIFEIYSLLRILRHQTKK
nr:hypothetical protein [Pseudopedobacter sp.]